MMGEVFDYVGFDAIAAPLHDRGESAADRLVRPQFLQGYRIAMLGENLHCTSIEYHSRTDGGEVIPNASSRDSIAATAAGESLGVSIAD